MFCHATEGNAAVCPMQMAAPPKGAAMIAKVISYSSGSKASPRRNPIHSGGRAPKLVMKRPATGPRQTPLVPGAYGVGATNAAALWENAVAMTMCCQSCALHMWRELACMSPWHSACFEIANQWASAYAENMMSGFGVPPIRLLHAPGVCPEVGAEVSPEVLERSMDIAIGARAA
jgi:hypothetical protein